MPVDSHLAGLLEFLASSQVQPMHESSPEQAREAFRTLTVALRKPESVVPVRSVEDCLIPGPAGALAARVYRPDSAAPVPTVVLFHGGGWVIGDLDTHDNMARSICRDCDVVVVSVDYRLAPEAPFPAAVEDAVAATRWVADHLGELGGDDRLAVAGDSAGGNLAAVVAQDFRKTGGPALAAQFLVYPATDATGDYPSRTTNGEGYFLDLASMVWFMGHYAADAELHLDPRLSPLQTEDLSELPPAVVVTAEFDPLRDEGEAYAARLEAAGVRTVTQCFDGMIHGFFDMGPMSPGAQQAVDASCALFATLLHPPAKPAELSE